LPVFAILEIEEAVRENGSFSTLLLRAVRPMDVAGGFGVMLGSLSYLPDLAAVALGSGLTVAATGHEAYKDWKEDIKNIESNQMYFYYGTRERLATVDQALAPVPGLPRRAERGLQTSGVEAKGAQVDAPQTDIEHEAQEFVEENKDLLAQGSGTVVGRIFVQGARITKALSEEAVEAANHKASVTRELAEAIKDPSTPARRIHELETERTRAKELHEQRSRFFNEFNEFMDRVESARQQTADGEEA
jgi:hypothetical protein